MLQTLNLKNMSEQTEMYYLVHYVADFKDEIIVYASERPAPHNYLVNMNHAESE